MTQIFDGLSVVAELQTLSDLKGEMEVARVTLPMEKVRRLIAHVEALEKALEPFAKAAPEPDEISPYEWMAQEFERLAILRKMWTADEVAAILRRYDIERPAASPSSASQANTEGGAE